MKLRLLALTTLMALAIGIQAQTPMCVPPNAPPAPSCATACIYCEFINGYAGTTIGQTPSSVPNFCGTIENDQWFGFIAGATSATFNAIPVPGSCVNGDGIQIALYPACGANNIGCDVGCNNCGNVTQSITVNNMVIGNNYFLVIDGYAGDGCNFTISVTPPSAVTAPMPAAPGAITGPNNVCPGQTYQYCIPLNGATSAYEWTIPADAMIGAMNGPGPITLTGANGRCANIKFGSTPGPVTVCVRPVNSCFDGSQVCKSVTIDPTPTAEISGSVVNCGTGPMMVTVPVTFTGNPNWSFTYKIDGGPNITVTGITSSPYNLMVSASSSVTLVNVTGGTANCPGTVSGSFTITPGALAFTNEVMNPQCFGVNDGSILIEPTSGTAPYNYVWSPSQGNTNNPTGLAPGVYTMTLTDANNCTKTATFDLPAPVEITISITDTLTANCTNPTGGGATANGAGGVPPLTYEWSNGQTTNMLTGVGAGSYTVTVTDSRDCTKTQTVEVPEDMVLPAAVADATGILNCTVLTLPLSGAGSATGSNINYNWSGGPINGPTNEINATASGPGTFTLLVTNTTNGCTNSAMVTIDQDVMKPLAIATTPDTLNCIDTLMTISGIGSSDGPDFTYLWSPGANIVSGQGTLEPVVETPGTYTILVTNTVNGCTETATVNQIQNINPPEAEIAPPAQIDCVNLTSSLDGSGSTVMEPATWLWSPDANVTNGQGTPMVDVNMAGTYTLIITNSNGCKDTTTVDVVLNNTLPTAVAAAPTPISCPNPNVPINGTGSSTGPTISYEWGGPDITGSTTTINTTAGTAGTYIITVTNSANGCSDTAMVEVIGNMDLPTAVANGSGMISCSTPTLTLSGTGSSTGPPGFTYLWTPTPQSGGTTLNPTINMGGTYQILVTNTLNSCTETASVTIDEDVELPTAMIAPPPQIDCINSTSTVDASGSVTQNGATFNWSPSAGIIGGQGTSVITVNAPGTWTVTITNPNGCTATATSTVILNNTLPTAVAAAPTPISCPNPDVPLNGTGSSVGGSITYDWSGPNVTGPTNSINTTAGLAGTYTITVTNTNNGCTATAMVDVIGDMILPDAVASTPGAISCTTPTLQLSGAGSSTGPPGFTYLWTPTPQSGGTTLNPTINMGGTYQILVTNTLNGCTQTAEVVVDSDTETPTAIISPPPQIDCINENSTVDASGSVTQNGATFNWSPSTGIIGGQGTSVITVNQPGTWSVTVTNPNGCTHVASGTVILNNTLPTAVANTSGQISCTSPDVPLIGTGSSVGGNFTYNWSGPQVSGPDDQINSTAGQPGVYTILVTNTDNGCTATDPVTVVGAIDFPVALANAPGGINCLVSTITLDGSGSSTGPGFVYNWTPTAGIVSGQGTLNPVVNMGGTYTLVVTNTNTNCFADVTVDVDENTVKPIAVIFPPEQLNCINLTVFIDGSGSDYNPGATFQWTSTGGGNIINGNNSLNPQVDQPGTYTLVITNQDNGCTDSESITVTQNNANPNAVANAPQNVSCLNPEVPLVGTGSSTGPTISYEWTTTNGSIVGPTDQINTTAGLPGTYYLLVTNSLNGCTKEAIVTVGGNTILPDAVAEAPDFIDCITTQVSVSGAGSAIGPTISWLWTASNGGYIVSGATTLNPIVNAAGTYTLVVTNSANGCTNEAVAAVSANTEPPQISILPYGDIDCNNVVQVIDAGTTSFFNGTGTFSWTTLPPGVIVSGANTEAVTVSNSGTYTVRATDDVNGCTALASFVVVENTVHPIANAGPNGLITCPAPVVALDGSASSNSPSISYLWFTLDGNITTDPTQAIIGADLDGTYTLIVIDNANGCSDEDDVVVTADVNYPTAIGGPEFDVTCSSPNVILNGAGSSTGNNFTYEWTTTGGNIVSGAATLNPVVNAAGTYNLLVTNILNGCTATAGTSVFNDQVYPTAAASHVGIISCTVKTVTLSGAGSSASGPFSYLWTTANGNIQSGETTLSPVVTEAGTYTILVTNTTNGCTATASTTVLQDNSVPIAVNLPVGQLDCNTLTQVIDATASSNGAGFSFTWSTANGMFVGPTNILNPTVNAPGEYVLTVTNLASQCTATATVNVLQDITAPPADAGQPFTLTCTKTDIQIGYALPPTDPNLTYSWTTTGGNFTTPTNVTNPTVDAPGTYNLLVTNGLTACTATATVVISEDIVAPTALALPGGTLTCTTTQLTLNASASSTGPNFIYSWTSSNGNFVGPTDILNPTVDAAGLYELHITNTDNGCTNSTSTTVLINATLPISAASAPGILTCAVPQITLSSAGSTGGAGISYVWLTPDGNIFSGNNGPSPVIDAPGNYSLQVTNSANNCTAVSSVFVGEDIAPPIADAGPQATIDCLSPQMLLDGTASSNGSDYSYLWTTTDGNIVSGATSLNPIIDAPGTYILEVTNNVNGCKSTGSVVILKDVNAPNAVIAQPGILDCDTPDEVLNGSASSQSPTIILTWTEPVAGAIIANGTTLSPTINQPGEYILNLIDTSNGCSDEVKITVTQDILTPPVDAGSPVLLTCIKTDATLGGPGNPTGSNFTFTWSSTAGGNIVSGQNSTSPLIDAPATYTILVTNTTNGCTNSQEVVVSENINLPQADAGPGFEINCQVKTYTMKATGSTGPNFTYLWTTTNGSFTTSPTILTPTVDGQGTYNLLITDVTNGCTATDQVIITQSADVPIAVGGPTTTLTCDVLTAILNGTGTTTGPGYSFKWTTVDGLIVSGDTTLMPTVGEPGTYKIVVTNSLNGCSATSSVLIGEDIAPPVISAGPDKTLTCSVTSINGTATASGSTQLTYLWTTNNGSILAGETTLTPTFGQPGVYKLLVTNELNGCTSVDSMEVKTDLNLPVVVLQPPAVLTCTVLTTTLNAQNGTTTGPGITHAWTTVGGNFVSQNPILNPTVDAPGIYNLLVTNTTNGCTTLGTTTVIQDIAIPLAEAGTTQAVTCTNPVLTLDGTGSSVGSNFKYQWTAQPGNLTGGQTTLMPTVNLAGTYTILVTNTTNGCTKTDVVIITPDQGLPTAVIVPPAVLTCADPIGTLDASASSSGAIFDLTWTTVDGNFTGGQSTLQPTVDDPGTYNLLIVNTQNGCTASASVVVTENGVFPLADAGPTFELTCAVEQVKLAGVASPLTIVKWTTPDGQILSGSNTLEPVVNLPGTYILAVTFINNGCSETDQVTVTEQTNKPTDLSTTVILPRCDSDVGEIVISSVTGGVGPYLYSINGGQSFFSEADFKKIKPGTYSLLIQDANGCEWAETLVVPAPLEPAITILPEIKIELGHTGQLEAFIDPAFPIDQIDTVIWSPMDGLTFRGNSIEHLLKPEANPLKNTTYTVTVISKAGCDASAKVLVRILHVRDVYIPNAITPWSGGNNGQLIIFADPLQVAEITAFEMFDRWGDKVFAEYGFQPNDPAAGWPAVVRSQKLNPGVFVYWAKVKFVDGEERIYKGDVTIVR